MPIPLLCLLVALATGIGTATLIKVYYDHNWNIKHNRYSNCEYDGLEETHACVLGIGLLAAVMLIGIWIGCAYHQDRKHIQYSKIYLHENKTHYIVVGKEFINLNETEQYAFPNPEDALIEVYDYDAYKYGIDWMNSQQRYKIIHKDTEEYEKALKRL